MTSITDSIGLLKNKIEAEYQTKLQRKTGMLRFDASFFIDRGKSVGFDEAKLKACSYEPFQTGLKFYASLNNGLQNPTNKETEYPTVDAALDVIRNIAADGNVLLDTLVVVYGDKPVSIDDEWYPIVMAALVEVFKRRPSDGVPNPVEARRARVKEHLDLLLRSGTDAWNSRALSERKMVDWRNSDYSGCKLNGLQLAEFDWTGSTFQGASMQKTDLSNAVLVSANLGNADLSGANLKGVTATGASFSGANLKGAHLEKVDLQGCSFDNADLSKARLNFADIRGVDFSTAKITKDTKFNKAVYDERTKLPSSASEHESTLVWAGVGPDPFKLAAKEAALVDVKVSNLDEFLERLNKEFDPERVSKTLAMLKQDTFQLFCEVDDKLLLGVVKSQTDKELLYACQLRADGVFCCCTQFLNACGGLRGALCKHLLVLAIGLVQAKKIDGTTCLKWILSSRLEKKPKLDRERIAEVFLKYKGAEAGEIDWRPTETMPEDYYAY